MAKKDLDWESIEREYRAGIRTLRDIASEYGVSYVYIQKCAKKYGWVKNLDDRIKARAKDLVNSIAVNNRVNKSGERDIIETVAQQQAAVLLTERADIKRLSALCEKFELELQSYADDLERKARIIKSLTDTRKTIIELRRRNYNINDNSNGDADGLTVTSIKRVIIDAGN